MKLWLVSVEFVGATDPDKRWWRAWSEKADRDEAIADALTHVPEGKREVRSVEQFEYPFQKVEFT